MRTLLETTARATDATHLELDTPMATLPTSKVKVIVQLETTHGATDSAPGAKVEQESLEEFMERIRRLNEQFPCPIRATTDELMRELREGEKV